MTVKVHTALILPKSYTKNRISATFDRFFSPHKAEAKFLTGTSHQTPGGAKPPEHQPPEPPASPEV